MASHTPIFGCVLLVLGYCCALKDNIDSHWHVTWVL